MKVRIISLLRSTLLLGLGLGTAFTLAGQAHSQPGLQPLSLYWSSQRGDNFTTATEAGARAAQGAGYQFVRIEACVLPSQQPDTVPLKLYWNARQGDNFTTATAVGERSAQASGYSYAETVGYVFPQQQPGTIPLQLYWSSTRSDNFTTGTNDGAAAAIGSGYRLVRIEGYAYPTSQCSASASAARPVEAASSVSLVNGTPDWITYHFKGEQFQLKPGERRVHRTGSDENPEMTFDKMNFGPQYATQSITRNLTPGHTYTFRKNDSFEVDLH